MTAAGETAKLQADAASGAGGSARRYGARQT
jgi:hypothetical protein